MPNPEQKIKRLQGKLTALEDLIERKSVEIYNAKVVAESSLSRLQLIMESVEDFIFTIDAKGFFVDRNKSFSLFCEAFQINRIQDFLPEEAIFSELNIEFKSEVQFTREFTGFSSAVISASPFNQTNQNDPAEVIYIIKLISEFERKLRFAEAEKQAAIEASNAKSQFLANMSHEIRTPLNSVIGITSLLTSISTDPKQMRLLEQIQISGNALLSLVNDVLDFSKIEAGELTIVNHFFYLSDLIQEVGTIFQSQAFEKDIDLDLQILTEEDLQICSDKLRIRQILINLVGNAIKFTESGSIKIFVGQEDGLAADNIVFMVKDTGIGMSQEQVKNIFKPFCQADLSTTREYGGTGLGLTICDRLSSALNGSMQVDSKEGFGSTFKVTLRDVDSKIVPYSAKTKKPLTGSSKPAKILVAEDNPANQLLMEALLDSLGHEIRIAKNGKEALMQAQRETFDLVFMDCQMPLINGFDATKLIRKFDKKTPIIALTASALRGDKEACLAAGMNDYLSKPLTLDDLKQVLINYLESAEQESDNVNAQIQQAANVKVVDFNALKGLSGIKDKNGDDLAITQLNMFVESSAEYIQDIKDAASCNDAERLRKSSHKFKSSCGIVGAKKLLEICENIEKNAKINNLEMAKSLCENLDGYLLKTKSELSELSTELAS